MNVFTQWNAAAAVRTASIIGAAHIPRAVDRIFLAGLGQELKQEPFERVNETIGPVTQAFERLMFPSRSTELFHLSMLKAAVERVLSSVAGEFPSLAAWTPDDISVQKYGPDDGITSHRDHARNRLIIAVVTVCGSGTVEVLGDERIGQPVLSCNLAAGDLMLLRAPGLLGGAGDDESRPFHRVHGASGCGPRIAAGFRHLGGRHGHDLH
ncbi:MAG TPA: hypothetical protein VMT99_02070 [Candidatus Paceibacterota bacterium]|nr:hypothetical protein [Candidatus Paceibacterota bacterium]